MVKNPCHGGAELVDDITSDKSVGFMTRSKMEFWMATHIPFLTTCPTVCLVAVTISK
jgi:hypothetical protein